MALCEAGALTPMCDLLGASDERTVCVLLDGLNNILSAARKQGEVDKVCAVIEECEGLGFRDLQFQKVSRLYKLRSKYLQEAELCSPPGQLHISRFVTESPWAGSENSRRG